MKKLNEILSSMKPERILDIATRDGAFVKLLSENLSGYDIMIGIDITDKGFAKAKTLFAENNKIRFEVMDGCKTNYPDRYFDLVCLSNSLHHVKDISSLLKEMLRIKKEEGVVLINEIPADGQSGASLTHALIHNLDCIFDTYSGTYHHRTYSREEIFGFVLESGLKIVHDFDDVEADQIKNAAIAERADKVLFKVNECKNTEIYEELHQLAMKIEENYHHYGANTATQYIIFAK